jgi:hypothetical protein
MLSAVSTWSLGASWAEDRASLGVCMRNQKSQVRFIDLEFSSKARLWTLYSLELRTPLHCLDTEGEHSECEQYITKLPPTYSIAITLQTSLGRILPSTGPWLYSLAPSGFSRISRLPFNASGLPTSSRSYSAKWVKPRCQLIIKKVNQNLKTNSVSPEWYSCTEAERRSRA